MARTCLISVAPTRARCCASVFKAAPVPARSTADSTRAYERGLDGRAYFDLGAFNCAPCLTSVAGAHRVYLGFCTACKDVPQPLRRRALDTSRRVHLRHIAGTLAEDAGTT